MTVSYGLRLVCLCLATFFLVNAFFSLLLSTACGTVIRAAKNGKPRAAAQFLLFTRLLPAAAGVASVFVFCVPSYVSLEPKSVSERVGWACFALVFLALTSITLGLARGMRAAVTSLRLRTKWQRKGRVELLPGETSGAVVVVSDGPLLALAGVLRPRLFLSESVAQALTAEELEVAVDHESAHRFSRDNLNRLLLLLAPPAVPGLRGFMGLEKTWAELSEWAADDEAAQGNAKRGVALASALLQVARLGATPKLSFLHTSLVGSEHELAARVERLLHLAPPGEELLPKGKYRFAVLSGILTLGALLVGIVPAALSSVHRLLELMVR